MASEVTMPRLGWSAETGTLAEWLKEDGDQVEIGDFLFSVEGDKATQEIEAFDAGILRIPPDSPPPGKEVPVGTLMAYIVSVGEEFSFESVTAAAPAAPQVPVSSTPAGGSEVTVSPARDKTSAPAISPRARRVAGELGVDWTGITGTGRAGRIVERDVRQAAAQVAERAAEVSISPVAQRVAEALGVDITELAARMPGQRIERADVEAAASAMAEAATITEIASAPPALLAAAPADTVTPISQVRRTIANRMATSAHTAASVTLTTEADATELVRLRNQLKSDPSQPVPSYNDLLAKLVAFALLEHPHVNARFDGDTIVQSAAVNVGIAVDTPRGLLVPWSATCRASRCARSPGSPLL